jgi:hypothetical protein
MATYESIGQMMQASARAAVQSASERFGFSLDFSEGSLALLETILTNVIAALPDGDSNSVERETKLWGSYFGEVVCRRWDGNWELATYPGSNFSVPAVNVRGSQLYPLVKVYRRITQGAAEDIWKYYQGIQQKLASSHT